MSDISTTAYAVSGVFALLALSLSLYHLFSHLSHYICPEFQRHICRILFLIPVYAFSSWFSLKYQLHSSSIYLSFFRDCYEAFVIYEFYYLLLTYVGEEHSAVEYLRQKDTPIRHMWPVRLIPYYKSPVSTSPERILSRCKRAVLQYCVVLPTTSILSVIFWHTGHLDPRHPSFAPGRPYLWLTLLNNISITVAMYALVFFYLQLMTPLKHFRPIRKFLCIKSIVFFTYWQEILLAILVRAGVISSTSYIWSPEDIAAGLQSFIICIELLPLAIAHYLSFPVSEFTGPTEAVEGEESDVIISEMRKKHRDTLRSGLLSYQSSASMERERTLNLDLRDPEEGTEGASSSQENSGERRGHHPGTTRAILSSLNDAIIKAPKDWAEDAYHTFKPPVGPVVKAIKKKVSRKKNKKTEMDRRCEDEDEDLEVGNSSHHVEEDSNDEAK